MTLPKGLTRCLLRATCDKTSFNRKMLRICRSFQEASQAINKPPKGRCRK